MKHNIKKELSSPIEEKYSQALFKEQAPAAIDKKNNISPPKTDLPKAKLPKNKDILSLFKKKQNLLIFILTLLSVSILAIILLFRLINLNVENQKAGLDLDSLMPGRLLFNIDKNDVKKYYPLSESILLKTEEGKSNFISPKGESLLTLEFGFLQPYIQEKDGTFVITEQNSNHYTVFNKKGLLYRGKVEASIVQAAISSDGVLALLVDQSKEKGLIKIFNNQGDSIFDIHIQDELNSGFIMDMFFDEQAENLYVSMLNLSATTPFSVINAYSYKKNHYGELVAEYKPQGNTALVQIKADTSNNLYAFSSKSLIKLNLDKSETLLTYNNLYNGSFYQDNFFVIAQATEGSAYRLKVMSTKDEPTSLTENDFLLPGAPNYFSHKGRYIAMVFGSQIYRFDILNPLNPLIYEMREPIHRINISSNGIIMVVTSSGVREIS